MRIGHLPTIGTCFSRHQVSALGGGGSPTVRSHVKRGSWAGDSLHSEVPCWGGGGGSNVSWAMVTWKRPSPVNRQTHTTENFIFLQLRWRAIKYVYLETVRYRWAFISLPTLHDVHCVPRQLIGLVAVLCVWALQISSTVSLRFLKPLPSTKTHHVGSQSDPEAPRIVHSDKKHEQWKSTATYQSPHHGDSQPQHQVDGVRCPGPYRHQGSGNWKRTGTGTF